MLKLTKDIDYDHSHGQGIPHVHNWDRPKEGGIPTHKNRKPGRQLKEYEF